MAQLEYRLLDEVKGFPALYHYESISKEEVLMRFRCDYLVKDGVVYEKTSNALESTVYIIYVKRVDDEVPYLSLAQPHDGRGLIVLEVREYMEDVSEYPILMTLKFDTLLDAALFAQCHYFMAENQEWEQTSVEVDEDRKTYVIYAQRTSYSKKGEN